jgi:hypothetical protein
MGQNAGEQVSKSDESHSIKNIDTVTLYLNPTRQRDYYNYIVEAKPKRVIFNPGTENPEFYQLLKLNDKSRSRVYISFVNDQSVLDFSKLFPAIHFNLLIKQYFLYK